MPSVASDLFAGVHDIQSLAFWILVTYMVLVGWVLPPGRVFSWPMYSVGSSVIVDLWADGTPVNIFDVRVPGEFSITTAELQDIVDFLMLSHARVEGSGIVLWAVGTSSLRVVSGLVVVDGGQ